MSLSEIYNRHLEKLIIANHHKPMMILSWDHPCISSYFSYVENLVIASPPKPSMDF